MIYKLLTLLAVFACAFATDRGLYEAKFYDWMKDHDVMFRDGEEYLKRLEIFIGWDKLIEEHNGSGSSWSMAHNKFSQFTHDEFVQMFLRPMPESFKNRGSKVHAASSSNPSAVDWTDAGAVTGVKDQGQCGSCWSFSATGSLEGAYYLKYGSLVSFSEQMLVSCDSTDAGCNGGWMDDAFQWISDNGGLCSEDDYPYTSGTTTVSGTCTSGCSVVANSQVASYTDVAESESAMESAVAQQPVSVAIQANQMGFSMYSGGVYTGRCGTRLDHGVLNVGYGTDSGTEYWKVKNSWGDSWGEAGYIRMEKGKDQTGGQCGILMDPSYPSL